MTFKRDLQLDIVRNEFPGLWFVFGLSVTLRVAAARYPGYAI